MNFLNCLPREFARADDVPPRYSSWVMPYLCHRLDIGPSFYFIYHYQQGRYVYVEKQVQAILQYPASALMSNSADFFLSRMHPEDVPQHAQVMQRWHSFYFSLPLPDRHYYSTSFDYRLRKKNGIYVRLLQQLVRMEYDAQGNVLYSLEKCTNISHWQKNSDMVLSVIGPPSRKHLIYYPDRSLPDASRLRFTRTETRIIKLLAQGFSSQEIAQQLTISLNTVNTHRRNMHRKAGVKSATLLVKIAKDQGLLRE